MTRPDAVFAKDLGSSGFSLMELMVALVILAIGVLGLAGVSAYTVQKVTAAELDTERGAALQTVVEQIRSVPFETLDDGADSVGLFEVEWTVEKAPSHATVEIVTTGPGRAPGSERGMSLIADAVVDTFTYTLTGS